jgi:hypothetical protein
VSALYPAVFSDGSGAQRLDGSVQFTNAANAPGYGPNPITSGALPTVTLTSTTAAQVSTSRNVTLALYWTTDGTNNAATLKVELSPDNVTFTTLDTMSVAAAINALGALQLLAPVAVPAGWYVKLTTVHSTIGATGVLAYY